MSLFVVSRSPEHDHRLRPARCGISVSEETTPYICARRRVPSGGLTNASVGAASAQWRRHSYHGSRCSVWAEASELTQYPVGYTNKSGEVRKTDVFVRWRRHAQC